MPNEWTAATRIAMDKCLGRMRIAILRGDRDIAARLATLLAHFGRLALEPLTEGERQFWDALTRNEDDA